MLFYASGILQPKHHPEVVSQIDILPTIASLTGQRYLNTTLGRDILDDNKRNNYAFIIHHDEGQIGMITNDFYFTKNLNFTSEELYLFPSSSYTIAQKDSVKNKMSEVTTAFYETAKWMLLNNKKEQVRSSK